MIVQVHFNRELQEKILCWHHDMNPQPSTLSLLAKAVPNALVKSTLGDLAEAAKHHSSHRHRP